MLGLTFFSSLLCLFVSRTAAAPVNTKALFPLPPASDPFYVPPAGYQSTAAGTVLKSRSVVTSFFGLIPAPVQAYQLLYRTTAVNGTPIATVTTVFKPLGAKLDSFVSFHTAYDSSATQCSPSYTYQLGAVQEDLITSVEFLVLQAYLLSGNIVASPDYEGPDAAFIPGILEGHAVLDGMRAVKNFGTTIGLSTTNPKIVGTGYSGGGQATSWGAALQRTYAPELNIVGWASGGTPANLTATLDQLDDTLYSGFLPPALNGLAKPSAYGAQLQPLIASIITPAGQKVLDTANSQCAVRDILSFSEQSILATTFSSLGANILANPVIAGILEQNTQGVNPSFAPMAPILLYHASPDEIIPYAPVQKLAPIWCSQGSTVTFTTYAAGGHATTELVGLPQALTFVENALAGNVPKTCTSNSVLTDSLSPLALGLDLEPVLAQLIDALAALGKSDSNLDSNLNVLSTGISN